MASSRDTRNGPDWQDVASAMANYSHFTGVEFVVMLTVVPGKKNPDLRVTALAHSTSLLEAAQDGFPSATVSCRQQGYIALESVVMKALFDLDVRLYQENGVL